MSRFTETPMAGVPIGGVLPFTGDASHSNVIIELVGAGWLPCDGSAYPIDQYAPLYAAIGLAHGGKVVAGKVVSFRVPNLRGAFARGVTGTATRHGQPVDPDAHDRPPPPRTEHANSGDEVGSYQHFATGRPHNPFVTDNPGTHTHSIEHVTGDDHRAYHSAGPSLAKNHDGSTALSQVGDHQHQVTKGGDAETRPTNIALSWIIRYR